ncbi:MAG TPA: hypothetical protein VFQ65_28485 [Kofleriaceae bacterium]|nr:hypothetical protein [Kofleriaceae bacterium]
MRAVLALMVCVASAGCRVDLDHAVYNDAQPRLCTPQPTSATCSAAVGHNDLTYLQANIIQPKCALSDSCHTNRNPQDMLDMSTKDKTFMLLVNQASVLDTSRQLVVPGNVNASLLAAFIGAIKPAEAEPALAELPHNKNGDAIGTMPYNSSTMCCEKIDAVSAWITAGAPNN